MLGEGLGKICYVFAGDENAVEHNCSTYMEYTTWQYNFSTA